MKLQAGLVTGPLIALAPQSLQMDIGLGLGQPRFKIVHRLNSEPVQPGLEGQTVWFIDILVQGASDGLVHDFFPVQLTWFKLSRALAKDEFTLDKQLQTATICVHV